MRRGYQIKLVTSEILSDILSASRGLSSRHPIKLRKNDKLADEMGYCLLAA